MHDLSFDGSGVHFKEVSLSQPQTVLPGPKMLVEFDE